MLDRTTKYSEYVPQSVWILKEIHCAVNARKIIIPFRIDDSPLSPEAGFLLRNCQWINAKDYSNVNEAFKQLCMAIQPRMKKEPAGTAVETPDVPSCEDVKNNVTKLLLIRSLAQENNADAQNVLARCYCNGTGVPRDEVEAVKWWRKAAAQGHPEAQNNLGGCYCKGIGVVEDKAEAVRWFRKAAEQGHKAARKNLELIKNGSV